MRQIAYSKAALRTLSRIPANTSKLIRSKIEQYASDPLSFVNNVRTLKGEEGVLRLRVGDWRVLFTESGEIIAVIRVAARGDVYE
ncbi:type II toxin-antitoxin system RelE family toxin [Methylobacterium thuringiense]|uniref:Cytotoxic translational repressor of toxin-antitoxin stability system n=1 Tax=Methylobacterium thuringiense TaxID=1003091 RepID=A0ABQ4TJ72_9HYPH|nr:type II toxin-antitoxin system RelE/ParE family toxin [Methylobacterium thuringiense]GJE55031.1 hypothetical protein EKPJFOCH_1518 [Methylobacterium thuringiense]